MTEGLISIIVPVYNAEVYLEACINSILAQTYENIEVILVCDDSPDKSGEICDLFAEKDSRVKVIHRLKDGIPSARNAGMDAAEGEFIGFVDSDDTIDEDMYRSMVKRINETGADVCVCGYKGLMVEKGYTSYFHVPNIGLLSPAQLWEGFIKNPHKFLFVTGAVWTKLIRARLLKKEIDGKTYMLRQVVDINGQRVNDSCGAFFADCVTVATNGITFVSTAPYNYMIWPDSGSSKGVYDAPTFEAFLLRMQESILSVLPYNESEIKPIVEYVRCLMYVRRSHNAIIRGQPKPDFLCLNTVTTILKQNIDIITKVHALLIYFLPKTFYLTVFRLHIKYRGSQS